MSKHKLLLADDSITIQKVVNLTFADEGIEVIAVGDGDSALQKIKEFLPDLVMADVNMPGLSGYQICETIKQNPQMREIPVILLVGSFEPFDETEARRVGADDFMTKPFQSIRQLVTKVSGLLEQNSHSAVNVDSEEFIDTLSNEEKPAAVSNDFDNADDEMIQADHYTGFAPETTKLDPEYLGETQNAEFSYDKIHTVSNFETETSEDFSGNESKFDAYQPAEIMETEKDNSFESIHETSEMPSKQEYSAVYDFDDNSESDDFSARSSNIEDDKDFAMKNAETEELSASAVENFTAESKFENVQTEEVSSPNAVSILDFDDLDLLELPPVATPTKEEKPAENTTTKQFTETVRSEVAAQTENVTASQLSPDAIEAIAQRVVEKLSEKFFDKEN